MVWGTTGMIYGRNNAGSLHAKQGVVRSCSGVVLLSMVLDY